MTLSEVREKYERLVADLPPGTLLPAQEAYRAFLLELDGLGSVTAPLSYDTDQAALALALSSKTVAHWCKAGRFPGARRTGGRGGKWIIPATAVRDYLNGAARP